MINTIESNKLFAEFVGEIDLKRHNNTFITSYKYDTDWEWLMRVVEKIESLGHDVFINTCVCRITDVGLDMFEDIECFVNDNKRQATYNACVEFVEWYNNQK
jgi:hypothetical protein